MPGHLPIFNPFSLIFLLFFSLLFSPNCYASSNLFPPFFFIPFLPTIIYLIIPLPLFIALSLILTLLLLILFFINLLFFFSFYIFFPCKKYVIILSLSLIFFLSFFGEVFILSCYSTLG